MKIKPLNPTTNGLRHQINLDKSLLLKSIKPFKQTITNHQRSNGRSPVTGHITAWHRGGGVKKQYRNILFSNEPKTGLVVGISYDPNRSAFISTNFDFKKRAFFNTIAINNVHTGSLIKQNSNTNELKLGFKSKLSKIPIGTIINNISQENKSISKYARSAGVYAQIIQLDKKHAKLKLPSNVIIKVSSDACASIGIVSNRLHHLIKLGKAGRNRNLNRRPIVRGIAMNPVDHPHGGRTNGGRPSVTPWGLPTKGKFYLKKRKIKKYA